MLYLPKEWSNYHYFPCLWYKVARIKSTGRDSIHYSHGYIAGCQHFATSHAIDISYLDSQRRLLLELTRSRSKLTFNLLMGTTRPILIMEKFLESQINFDQFLMATGTHGHLKLIYWPPRRFPGTSKLDISPHLYSLKLHIRSSTWYTTFYYSFCRFLNILNKGCCFLAWLLLCSFGAFLPLMSNHPQLSALHSLFPWYVKMPLLPFSICGLINKNLEGYRMKNIIVYFGGMVCVCCSLDHGKKLCLQAETWRYLSCWEA